MKSEVSSLKSQVFAYLPKGWGLPSMNYEQCRRSRAACPPKRRINPQINGGRLPSTMNYEPRTTIN
jgi:hypothetical protein